MQNQFPKSNPLQGEEPYQIGMISSGSATNRRQVDKVRLSQTKIEFNYIKIHRKIVATLLKEQDIDSPTKRLILKIYDKTINRDNIIAYYPYPAFEFTQHLCNGTLLELTQRCTSAVQINKKSILTKNS